MVPILCPFQTISLIKPTYITSIENCKNNETTLYE